MSTSGITPRVTPVMGEGAAHYNNTNNAGGADKYVVSLMEKLQRRLDNYQRQAAAGVGPTAVVVDGPPPHHSRTASGNVSFGPLLRMSDSPDEVSFVFSVGDSTPIPAASGAAMERSGLAASVVPPSVNAEADKATADAVRVRPTRGAHHSPANDEREIYAMAEELCTELNGGVNYRLLCQQYATALEAVTTMVRQDIALLRNAVVLPKDSVVEMTSEVHQLLGESARLLKEAGVIDVTKTFAAHEKPPAAPPRGALQHRPSGASDAVEDDLAAHQTLNRVNTEPYMRSIARHVKQETTDAATKTATTTAGAVDHERREDVAQAMPPPPPREVSPPPHPVGAPPPPGPYPPPPGHAHPPGPPPPPGPAYYGASRVSPSPNMAGSSLSPAAGGGGPVAMTAPTRRLHRLEQLFGEAYTHDGDQFIRDVLGVIFRYQYDTLPPSAYDGNAATTTTTATADMGVSGAHMTLSTPKRRRSSSVASTASTLPISEDVLAHFRDFKAHTTDVVSALLVSYDALKEGSFDSTPLRGDYVYQCLLSRTKPHEKVLALLDAVKEDRNVEVIDLSGTRLGDAAAAPLLHLLPRLHRLHTLNLQQCDLHDETISLLAGRARAHPTLSFIDLSRNDVTDAAFEDLASLYLSIPRLSEVALVGCPVSGDTRAQLSGVKSTALSESFNARSSLARSQLASSARFAPVRPHTALHSYASLKSTAKQRRTSSELRAESVPYRPFAAAAPAHGVYAYTLDRRTSQPRPPPPRGSAGSSRPAPGTGSSLPPIRPH